MALIDRKLADCNLQRNTAYTYVVGDCLFDSIAYLLRYDISSEILRINTMQHLAFCISLNTPKALQTLEFELNEDWLYDLHTGVFNAHQYIQRMSLSARQGGLWGDFTAIKWVSDYLQRPIYVWSTESGKLIDKEGSEFQLELFHLAFGSRHFEPIEKLNQSMPIVLPLENTEIEIINLESDNLYEELDSQKTWKSSTYEKGQLYTQSQMMNIENCSLINQSNVDIEKIVNNGFCNKTPTNIKSKTKINKI